MNPLYEIAQRNGGDLAAVPADLAAMPRGCLQDAWGITLTHVGRGRARATMTVLPGHLNQRGFPQGGALVAFADAAAGWASYAALEEGRFTTNHLSCSYLGAASAGADLVALAEPVHIGRSTLVLDVAVLRAEHEAATPRKLIARVTCTQLVLS